MGHLTLLDSLGSYVGLEILMRSDKQTQGVRFMFRLRHVLAKPWFINNNKYIQDWPRGQPNKSSTSFKVMERRDQRSSTESTEPVDHFVQRLHAAVDQQLATMPRLMSVSL